MWLRTSQPPTRASSSTIFGTFNEFPVSPATRFTTRFPSEAGVRASFEHHRELTGVLIALQHVHGLIFNHLNVACRLHHASGLSDTLAATTAKLKEDGYKVPLLNKVSQAPSWTEKSRNSIATSHASKSSTSEGVTRISGPSTNGWFEPEANKESGHVADG